ncbi:MAG TPA: efflux RND transporter permease subunit [Oligoflexus sp.]|uniref:efflux RND transporter permease subunit n=1 Tax=Oligoflexus sp. TaxID=1971216 RepID=UPI002D7F3BC8|nr:efflux RND transporter permease subunit [Oligoflexus sp.]HET9240833.1 efflux RND transporter permease subunit [Oligoflexus sp.]
MIEMSIRRPVFAWVLMFALIVFGAICLNRMGISQMPDVDFPVLNISVNYEGAAPEVVEADLIVPLEERLLTIEGIKEMRSSASQGSGRITLEFDINRNIDIALQEVQSAISQFRMPTGTDPAIVRKSNPEEDPILIVSIYGDKEFRELLNWTNNYLLDQLRFLPGVGAIDIGGFSERNLRVWFDPKKLNQYQLTVSDVVDALRTQHLESAAGQFTEGDRELRVRWLGEATAVEEVGNILILRRGGQIIHGSEIRIRDVAKVEDGLSDIRRVARYEGKPTISLRISKQRGTNEVEVSEALQERLKELSQDFPQGIGYRVNVDFTRSTKSTVELTMEKIWMAGVITILVCFFFLGSFQAALNILFSIPTSIVGTFIVLYFSGFTLNLFTLLALTLSISIVVDDAIMLLENIVRHYRMGKGSFRAAAEGAKEVLPAASAATLAMVAIFIPVVFMEGVIGKFFFQFGVTISAAVLISLLEAVTITPMRAAALLRNEPKVGRFEAFMDRVFERIGHAYRVVLKHTLHWRYLVILVSLVGFVLSLGLVKKIRQEFIPPQDQDILIINGQAPPGSSLEFTDQLARKVEAILKTVPEIEAFATSVGAGGGGSAQLNQVFFPLRLVPKEKREKTHVEIMADLRAKFRELKGIRMNMRDISSRNLSSGRQNPIGLSLRGPDLAVLGAKAQELIKKLEDEKLGVDLDTDYRAGIPELRIEPNRKAMAERGVSVDAVGQILTAAVGGLRSGRYTAEGKRYDVRFKLPDEMVRSAEDIKRLYVRNIAGNLIPLRELVTIEEGKASQSISRVNRMRAVSVYGNLAPGQSQAKVLQRSEELAQEILPPDYIFALEGASAGFNEAFASLYSALLIGILVAYLILAVQFDSFVHPISILMALPFSVTGALLALWLTNQSLNLFSFIGLIVLMGIAKKNSIMLVEFANHVRREKKLSVEDALLEASPVRLRPIIMTSVATVAAATPLVLGGGMGSEARLPMGLAIIGGTIVSTLLTLFVVPAFYMLLSKLENKKRHSMETVTS